MRKYLFLLLLLPFALNAQALKSYYTNILKDEKGNPVSGATVTNQTTRQSVSTNKNGYFSIAATAGQRIHIAYVGYAGSTIIMNAAMLHTDKEIHPETETQQKTIEPVISNDYTALIRQRIPVNKDRPTDSTTVQNTALQIKGNFYTYLSVKDIAVHNNQLQIYYSPQKYLTIGGNYSSTIEIKSSNQTPALQTQYVQGRPQNGALVWRGPETGELFSFGPATSSLEFDGNTYPYDTNGRLVAAGNGNGNKATAYPTSILHTALLHSQLVNLHGTYIAGYERKFTFNIKAGQSDQSTIIRQNDNSAKNISGSVGATINHFTITGNYNYIQNNFSNSNRNGFLNRVYQNALLTPVSFDNFQGYQIANAQRSYSVSADNPYFLLADNGNSYLRSQNNASLTVEQKKGNLSWKLIQSMEVVKQINNEGYKASTAYFGNDNTTQRLQKDYNYLATVNAIYTIPFSTYHFQSYFSTNYEFNNSTTNISYSSTGSNYRYQRATHDFSINNSSSYRNENFESGIEFGNKFYLSNTASQRDFLLPFASGYVQLRNVLDHFIIKLRSSYHSFNNELPINQSLAYTSLLQLIPQQSFQYFPVQEVTGYGGLLPIYHWEWTGGIEINYKSKWSFAAETFNRHTLHDVFPIVESGKINLKNVAAYRNKGVELQLSFNDYRYRNKLTTNHRLSFITYQNRVTDVENGYNFLPVAGFSNIHKAVIKGRALSAIVGSAYLRDDNNNMIIGNDGYPLVINQPQVIGNSTPEFVMKLNNGIQWKNLSINVDWEWKKGGDIWNGTEATLDYYGRSKKSAKFRNIVGYIFPGVMQNGQKNNVPVSFLNPNEPIENNRWTRYGYSGVAEEYIQKADYVKVNSATIAYRFNFKKYLQVITISAYINNILLWSKYKGADPNQLLFDQPNSSGLDFFNLPSVKTVGLNVSIQF